jgi:hypothetical protein
MNTETISEHDYTRVVDVLSELSWIAPNGADLSGYSMEHYFALDVHEVYTTRKHAIRAMLLAYRGADEHDVEINLSALRAEVA